MGAGNTGGRSFGSGGAIVDDAAFASWLDEVAPVGAAEEQVLGLDVALAEAGIELAAFVLALIVRPIVVAARRNARVARGGRS